MRKGLQRKRKEQLPKDIMEVDLHGMRVEEAIDVLEQALSDAVIRGKRELHVIHGRGTGRLKTAVTSYLKRSSFSSSEKLNNPGTTIVYL